MSLRKIKKAIRDVVDFPKPGVIFKDITPVLGDPDLFKSAVSIFVKRNKGKGIQKVAAIESRGFMFGAAIALKLGVGFVPIRKKGKLPYRCYEESYDLEYGSAAISIHEDAFIKGEKVLLFDDLMATGGTAGAALKLIERVGGVVAGVDFLIELAFLNGREKLVGYDVYSAIVY